MYIVALIKTIMALRPGMMRAQVIQHNRHINACMHARRSVTDACENINKLVGRGHAVRIPTCSERGV